MNLDNIKLVVFDVDCTLYDIKKMRAKIKREIIWFLLFHPTQFNITYIILKFRESRESMTAGNLEERQYSETAAALKMNTDRVKEVIKEWMFTRPLKHLHSVSSEEMVQLIEKLKASNTKIALWSDYPVKEKLLARKIPFEGEQNLFYSADPKIDACKPDPKGLKIILETYNLPPQEVLLIGDRMDKDAQAAKAALRS